MGIKSLNTGRRGYLTRPGGHDLYIKVGSHVDGEVLHVAYDIRVEGVTILPKGAIVIGDWITNEEDPTQAMFMTNEVFVEGQFQEFIADSDIYNEIHRFNADRLSDPSHFYLTSTHGANHRIINKCRHMTIRSNREGDPYIRIPAQEIPFTIVDSFVTFRSGKYTDIDEVRRPSMGCPSPMENRAMSRPSMEDRAMSRPPIEDRATLRPPMEDLSSGPYSMDSDRNESIPRIVPPHFNQRPNQ
jgi:hypothetical protein